jgi:hypothetical protein
MRLALITMSKEDFEARLEEQKNGRTNEPGGD